MLLFKNLIYLHNSLVSGWNLSNKLYNSIAFQRVVLDLKPKHENGPVMRFLGNRLSREGSVYSKIPSKGYFIKSKTLKLIIKAFDKMGAAEFQNMSDTNEQLSEFRIKDSDLGKHEYMLQCLEREDFCLISEYGGNGLGIVRCDKNDPNQIFVDVNAEKEEPTDYKVVPENTEEEYPLSYTYPFIGLISR